MFRFRTAAAIVASMTVLVVSHDHVSAMVLCVGSDGHVEVEAAVAGNCAPVSDPHSGDQPQGESGCTTRHDHNHCGECLDIPLELGAFDRSRPVFEAARNIAANPGSSLCIAVKSDSPLPAWRPAAPHRVDGRARAPLGACPGPVVLRI